jgi:hypothetical protein
LKFKQLIKKTFLYPWYLKLYKKYCERKNNRFFITNIRERIATNSLLKDLTEDQLDHWNKRIETVLVSGDNSKIKCVKNAGKLKGHLLVMHNGIVIEPLSYYGFPVLKMLVNNKGIHEPQEEYAFQEVLNEMPAGATMIELGAYWSFYSMWFNKRVKNAINYMIEPAHLDEGIKNFKLNNLSGNFFKAYIGDTCSVAEDGINIISVDCFTRDNKIEFVEILHSDIQGFELLMLKGAINLLSEKRVGYIFISTHSNELHTDCMKFLESLDYLLICSANLQQSYSWDGLLVYKNPEFKGVQKLDISLRY